MPFAYESPDSKSGSVYDAEAPRKYHGHLEPKYAGTAADHREMAAMGRAQELRVSPTSLAYLATPMLLTDKTTQRNFKFVSVLGFGCTLIGTWNFFLG